MVQLKVSKQVAGKFILNKIGGNPKKHFFLEKPTSQTYILNV